MVKMNTIHDTTHSGILLFNGGKAHLVGNIIYNCQKSGIEARGDQTQLKMQHNRVFGCSAFGVFVYQGIV